MIFSSGVGADSRRSGLHGLRIGTIVCILLACILLGATTPALAQRATGTIAGNVTDAQGSIVTNAIATATSVDQGTHFSAKANAKGEYLFADIPVGTYDLKVSAPTFQAYLVHGVVVDAEQNARVDAHLTNGDVSAEVTVEAGGATVDTRSATVAAVIDTKLVEDLPIDGENVVSLAALLPGVADVNAPTTFTSDTGGPTYNVSGSRANQNLFLLDGFYWNNSFYNTGLNFPPPRTLSEVSVLLENYKAQYGRNIGSIFNAITRAGTNTIHGSVWEYFQNNIFDARDWISHRNPHLVYNQFGGTLGGPVLKNKLFYFLAFQDLRDAGEATAQAQTPTYEQRGLIAPGVGRPCVSSVFAGRTCARFEGTTQQVQNPVYSSTYGSTATSMLNAAWHVQGGTGTSPCVTLMQPFTTTAPAGGTKQYLPNQELPDTCFNPVAVAFLAKYVPVPNQASIGGAAPEAVSSAKQPRNDYNGFGRFDLTLGRHTVDGRTYFTSVNDITSNSSSSGTGVANYEQDLNTGGIAFGGIGDTWIVTPNLVNILRVGYKRYRYSINPLDTTTLHDLGSTLIVPASKAALPTLEATNAFTLGSTNSGLSYTLNANYEINDNVSWTHGTHNFQFGAQFLNLQYIHRFDGVPFLESEQQNTEFSTGDFLLGLLYTETVSNSTNLSAQQRYFAFYGQDDWRITSRLTLNLGLRYELPLQWYQPNSQSLTFVPGAQSTVFPTAPPNMQYVGDHGIGKSIVPSRFNDFGPRFGLAYDLFGNGSTSIRAGVGLFYDAINANIVGVGEPYHYTAGHSRPPGGLSDPLLGFDAIPANYTPNNPQFATPYSVNFADRNLTTPYTEAYNLGIQQKLPKSGTLELNYIAKLGRHQIVQFDMNPAIYDCSGGYFVSNPALFCSSATTDDSSYQSRVTYPNFNYGGQGVVDNASIATSNYNGMQVIFRERARHTLTAMASYTYSRSLDLQSNGQTNQARFPMPGNLRSNYGPSDFQSTHIFNTGFTWTLPTTSNAPKFVRAIVNHWRVSGIVNYRSGHPINVFLAGDLSLTDERPQRPLAVPGVSPKMPGGRSRAQQVAQWFNTTCAIDPATSTCNPTICAAPAAFCNPPKGTFGNVGRNTIYGPSFFLVNSSVARRFSVARGKAVEFKVDAFNLLNRPNFANPNSQLTSSGSAQGTYGTIQSTVGTNGVVGTNGRRLQLSLIATF